MQYLFIILFFTLAGICGITALLLRSKSGNTKRNFSESPDITAPNTPSVFHQDQYPSKLGEYQPQPRKMPPAPKAPVAKWLSYTLGVTSLLGGLYLTVAVDMGTGFLPLLASAILFWAGAKADEIHTKNMKHRAEAQEQWARTEVARVATETARHTAQRNVDLLEGQHLAAMEQAKADYISNQLKQLEIRLRGELAPIAKRLGVTIEQVIQYNAVKQMNELDIEHKRSLDELELHKNWKEFEQKLRGADLLILATNQQIKELLGDYEAYVKRLDELENDTTISEGGRKMLRGQLKGYLNDIEKRIQTLRTRPVSSQNGEKARRPGKSRSNSRTDYPPESDEYAE
jgi:hypothetical protein